MLSKKATSFLLSMANIKYLEKDLEEFGYSTKDVYYMLDKKTSEPYGIKFDNMPDYPFVIVAFKKNNEREKEIYAIKDDYLYVMVENRFVLVRDNGWLNLHRKP